MVAVLGHKVRFKTAQERRRKLFERCGTCDVTREHLTDVGQAELENMFGDSEVSARLEALRCTLEGDVMLARRV